ncbi:SPOR domain-containing protein [Qipengyuania nanhaisediminis]|uniref:Sporulation related domain-containing protein n=1 Tax=Qipengyuania nanhaisediminis TaxID=604088 RepID=A0A1I5LLD2_9SPHN|nr:SPOR domain-containing protein [Qipengyuania nanhaisediminis]SFO98080.1 Sporulation related domain-containing protein [Qipengyuania nanhaisediminis]
MQTKNQLFVRLAVTTALATTGLAGCSGKVAPTASHSAAKAEVALQKGKADKAVKHAEAAVLASPRDAHSRTLLANAYLEAGRFQSASQTFSDAVALGDTGPRTVVSLALAQIGAGDQLGAIETLERWEASLDPADFGLAIALAGQPERGVHVLSNAIRGGQNTTKTRQNLAYVYALSGQWRAARLMAMEDVPANEVGDRMAEWGALASPQMTRVRVARLMGVDFAADSGQPAMLALSNNPSVPMLAAETVEEEVVVEEPAPSFAFAGELPAVDAAPQAQDFGDAQLADAGLQAAPRKKFVAEEMVQPTPVAVAAAPKAEAQPAAPASRQAAKPAPKAAPSIALAKGDYNIQLGSYFSMSDAQDGWRKFQEKYPELADAKKVITKARVNGKIYYRVAAAGFAKNSAQSMCSTVKGKGGGCIAYASANPLPGHLGDAAIRVAAR